MSDKHVSAAELSRLANVNKQTVSRKIKQKILVPASYTESGRSLFELESSLKILEEQKTFDNDKSNHHELLLNKGGRPPKKAIVIKDDQSSNEDDLPTDDITRFNKARADKAFYQAKLAEIEVNEKLKTVVSVDSVKQQGSELGSILLNALTNLPDRLSDELASLDDAREIHKLLTNEINMMMIDIRKQLGALESE